MPIEPILESHVARLDDEWRLQIVQLGTRWEARLRQGGKGEPKVLGRWSTCDEAKVRGVELAQEFLEPRGVSFTQPLAWGVHRPPSYFEVQLRDESRREKWMAVVSALMGLVGVAAALGIGLPQSLFRSRTNESIVDSIK
jgi:hypothetical protein